MTEEQKARAELKDQFFDVLQMLDGRDATCQLYGKHVMAVKFLAMQANGKHYIVEDLKTPAGTMEHAVLRTGDTMFLSFPLNNVAPEANSMEQ
uniref:Gem-associated protein 7 n=1 Tax=Panagrolaimus sp. JU765 TaxID=591449 RepID=A0AC34QQF5_9BILA